MESAFGVNGQVCSKFIALDDIAMQWDTLTDVMRVEGMQKHAHVGSHEKEDRGLKRGGGGGCLLARIFLRTYKYCISLHGKPIQDGQWGKDEHCRWGERGGGIGFIKELAGRLSFPHTITCPLAVAARSGLFTASKSRHPHQQSRWPQFFKQTLHTCFLWPACRPNLANHADPN